MESGRDGLDILRYIYMVVLVYTYITGINTTACTDQTSLDTFFHVLRMCSSATIKNVRLVIDSWGTGQLDIHSCSCTVTLGTASEATTTTVVVEEYPGISPLQNCGSSLTITSTKSNPTKTVCTPIPSTSTNNFGTSDMLTLTLSRSDVSTSWTSGHCILISSDENTDLIVTCSEAQGETNQPPPTTTLSTTTVYVPTTTTKPLTTTTTTESTETTTSSREATASTQLREVITHNDTSTGQTSFGQGKCVQECLPQQGYPLSAVVAPLVVTMVITVVSMATNVILYRRLALVNQPKNPETVMTSPNPVHYDSLDLSRVEPPNLYAETSSGQTYVNTAMQS